MNDSITVEEVQRFYQNLATQLEQGDTIVYSLEHLACSEYNTYFKCILDEVYESVLYGQSLSDALMRHPSIFELEHVDLIREGEDNNTLTEALQDVGAV